MPLTTPKTRTPLHTRQIECIGYERDDGLYDIEAHMTDVKHYSYSNKHRGHVDAGEAVHDMWIRITVDDDLLVHSAEASTDTSPYPVCPSVNENYKKLEGLQIGPGWNLRTRNVLKGTEGCTHLTELLGPLATTAYQTVIPRRKHQGKSPRDPDKKPSLLGTCRAYASDGEIVKEYWPKFYTGS